MKKYTVMDYIVGTSIVFLIITSIQLGNMLAMFGWASALLWFHLYINKSLGIKTFKLRRK